MNAVNIYSVIFRLLMDELLYSVLDTQMYR